MKLGVITYDAPHLKTQQVVTRLAQRGQMMFFALPFVSRPTRQITFRHRPDMATGAQTRDVAEAIGATYQTVASADEIPADAADMFIILGAGLLPASFVKATAGRVINAHPGIIPLVRGLDAFKWAIMDGMPIGNTIHFIDEEADAGEVIAVVPTPVSATDTLESFARRHYDAEIDMMAGFESLLARRTDVSAYETRPARMRMPAAVEAELAARFEAYKDRFALGMAA